jgi:hypothetical protein
MRAAAVNLLKGTVERSFQKLNRVREDNATNVRKGKTAATEQAQSPFTSPLLLKTFGSSVWRFETKPFEQSPLKSEGAWLDKYDFFMHGLNFYLFLLIRDTRDDNLVRQVLFLLLLLFFLGSILK